MPPDAVPPDAAAPPVVRVCFVCSGNICRSPMAEAVFRRRLADEGLAHQIEADSAGTGGWHVGQPTDPRALATLRRRGYELAHRARQFDPAWFDRLDLVVALDEGHFEELTAIRPPGPGGEIRLLRSFDPAAHRGELGVPDPYYRRDDGFDHVLDLIEAAIPGLLAHTRRLLAGAEGAARARP